MREIASPANPLIKRARGLRLKKNRDSEGAFYIEGIHHVLAALDAGVAIETLIHSPDLLSSVPARDRVARFDSEGGDVVMVTVEAFEAISERDNPTGLAAIAPQLDLEIESLDPGEGLVVVAHEVGKPGNLGSILRSADAVGARGVIVSGNSADVFDPAAVRASLGALFRVPVVLCAIGEVVEWSRERGVTVVTTSASALTDYRDVTYAGPVALVLGSEGRGLPRDLMEWGQHQVTIPMKGRVTSLNVAVAAGILLFGVAERMVAPTKEEA